MEEISKDILIRIKRGDAESFRVVVGCYQKFVFSLLFRFLAGKYPEELENMATDIFVKIFNFIRSYDPDKGAKFSICVHTIVRNYCFNELRIKRLEADHDRDYTSFEQVEDIENDALAGELLQRFEKCIETLPDDQRIIIILKDFEGFSYEEAGAFLNLPVSDVKNKFNKAKVKLKDLLWPYLKEDHGKAL